jgi:hypothetical protein
MCSRRLWKRKVSSRITTVDDASRLISWACAGRAVWMEILSRATARIEINAEPSANDVVVTVT